MTFYTERKTRMIYDVRSLGEEVLVRPATPGLRKHMEKLDIGKFVDRFEEFLGDPSSVYTE